MKTRYTLNEVNKMFKQKYPLGYNNGATEIEGLLTPVWGSRYRIGYDYYFKTLKEIVEKLRLCEE